MNILVSKAYTSLGSSRKADRTLYFISTKTLDVFTSLSVKKFHWDYDRGLLFQSSGKRSSSSIVRVLDVASGKHYNDVHLPFMPCSLENGEFFTDFLLQGASSNSNAMVIDWKCSNKNKQWLSQLSVYDLEAVKNPNSDPGSHLLYTLQFQFNILNFVMDETRLALIGKYSLGTDPKRSMMVLNFAKFNVAERKSSDLKKNP